MFKNNKLGLGVATITVLIISIGLFSLPRANQHLDADFTAGSFSLTSNNNYCVGQSPTYTITAPTAWAGQTINWRGSRNGSIVNQTTFTLGPNGSWSQSGNTWGISDVGTWTKTASINGVSQSLNFNVQNCGGVSSNGNFNPNATNIIGSSDDSFGAGSNAVDISFPINTVGSSNSNLYGGFNGPDTVAPVYLANGTVVYGNQTSNNNNSGNNNSGRAPYYDQNGYLCKPPGSW